MNICQITMNNLYTVYGQPTSLHYSWCIYTIILLNGQQEKKQPHILIKNSIKFILFIDVDWLDI
jgi:hypothetical protein